MPRKGEIEIVYRRVADLEPYAKNSRTHSEPQVAEIAAAITEFGFTNPVLLNGKQGILAGHGRILAARSLGIDRVPCIQLGHLTPAQQRAYVIADNKLALNAGWDHELLAAELRDLAAMDFNVALTGFAEDELKRLSDEADASTGAGPSDEDENLIVTQPGDVWLLGPHRLICSTEATGSLIGEKALAAVDVAIERWQKFSGADARLETTGQTFADTALARKAA